MTVEELVKEYSNVKKNKAGHSLKEHIITNYLPHAEKLALVKNVINASSYVEVEGKQIYKKDTPTKIFLFSMKMISAYTDIEIHNDNIVNEYDALVSSGAMDNLLSCIDEKEINILKGLLDMVEDDLEANTRSLISFLETKVGTIQFAIDALLDVLERPEIKEKLKELNKSNE